MPLDSYTNIDCLAVEIIVQETQNKYVNSTNYGSGILYIQKNTQKAAVLTAAHLIEDVIRQKTFNLVLRYYYNGAEKLLKLHDEKSKMEHIEISDMVVPGKSDGAIIIIEWEDWMMNLPQIDVAAPQSGDQIDIFAFPYSTLAKDTGTRDLRHISGKVTISPSSGGRPSFLIEYNNYIIGDSMEPSDFFHGCSGGGVVANRNGAHLIIGIFTECMPSPVRGNVILANNGTIFQQLLSRRSFDPCVSPEIFSIDSFTEELSVAVRNGLNYKLKQLSLRPDSFKDLPQYKIQGLQLQCAENHHCNNYWAGRALCAVLLRILLGTQPPNWEQVIIPINGQKVHIEQLCTEENLAGIIRRLIQNNEAFSSGIYKNNTLFIVNGKNNLLLREKPKKECQSIIGNITQNKDELCDKFSITDGDPQKIAISFVQNCALLESIEKQRVQNNEQYFSEEKARIFLMKELESLWN